MAPNPFRARKQRLLQEADAFRQSRRAARDDVTVFGEELTELHLETLGVELDDGMRADYQAALEAYERSKILLRDSSSAADIRQVVTTLEDGRFLQACVLARSEGVARPERREPCFFNPQHGPARADVSWVPPGGVEREIPVCLADARRLAGGEAPDTRLVRVGDRWVPWFAAGEAYDSYSHGYFGPRFDAHRVEANRLAALHGTGLNAQTGSGIAALGVFGVGFGGGFDGGGGDLGGS